MVINNHPWPSDRKRADGHICLQTQLAQSKRHRPVALQLLFSSYILNSSIFNRSFSMLSILSGWRMFLQSILSCRRNSSPGALPVILRFSDVSVPARDSYVIQ